MFLVDVEKENVIFKYETSSKAAFVKTLSWIPNGHGVFITGGKKSEDLNSFIRFNFSLLILRHSKRNSKSLECEQSETN